MSQENGGPSSGSREEVVDEEGDVDSRVKMRIFNSREAINENENILFTQRAMMPDVQISRAQAIVAWGHCVRRYVRDVEILLTNENIQDSQKYYNEVELGSVTLTPPDKDGYKFSRITNDRLTENQLKRQLGLPHDCELPKPHSKRFTGVKSIIEVGDMVSKEWGVCVDKDGPSSEWDFVTLRAAEPVPKSVYELAVRYTDQFLQNAGIGLDVDTAGSEIIRNFDMSGEEPQAEYGTGDYDANPDI